jgi:hypothetical protein
MMSPENGADIGAEKSFQIKKRLLSAYRSRPFLCNNKKPGLFRSSRHFWQRLSLS